jgi:hypothetical protein
VCGIQTEFTLIRRRWQLFHPGEVEGVVTAAGNELNAAVAGLRSGEVAVGIGFARTTGRDEAAVGPCFAFVVRHGGEEAHADNVESAAGLRSLSVPLGLTLIIDHLCTAVRHLCNRHW